jgi:asparagine synthase (glutamine-hydrolysing)
MCGIVGQATPAGRTPDPQLLHRMCEALEHRGPDSRGVHTDDGVGLGIQRLSIIDLKTGDQPIFNEDRSVVVVLNGEIYNFRELREDLERRGHRFSTRADTEVIVHLYEEHGVDCVEHLHGMFGLAVWDTRRRRLLLARDRAGKKPLFYALRDGTLSFASELTALMEDETIPRDLDLHALDHYLAYRYIPSPYCAFAAVRKLPPAHRLVLDADGVTVDRYWELDFATKLDAPDEELIEALRDELRTAVRRRMISDVPLGAFLSGGIDSSAVVWAMAEHSTEPVKTFSIGFEDPALDERDLARLVAQRFGTDHHELVVDPDAIELIPAILRHYGEPFADATALPTFHLARMAREHVTVALNGDGGDETFGGYERYRANIAAARANAIPAPLRRAAAAAAARVPSDGRINSTRSRVRRLGATLAMDPGERFLAYMTTLQGLDRDALYTAEFRAELGPSRVAETLLGPWRRSTAPTLLDRMLDVDSQTYLPDDLLCKVDIATMAASLEGRSPMLDHRFMQFAASLPARLKIDGKEKKVALKRALRGHVPDAVLDAPKRGFQPPLARWFRGELREHAREVLLDKVTVDRGYFDRAALTRLLDDHAAGRADHSQAIWTLLIFERWHREGPGMRDTAAAAAASRGAWT